MKTIKFLFFGVVCGFLLVGLTGCGAKKKATATGPKTVQEAIADLNESLSTASTEMQSNYWSGVASQVRYARYDEALATLQQMAASPSLTPKQKDAINATVQAIQQEAKTAEAQPAAQ